MDKNSAKQKIQELVEKYEEALRLGKIKGYTEQETKNGFIEPLFKILGWDMTDKNEISLEEQISGDRADYGFYLNGRAKFYLEAKKLSADLWNEKFAEQCIKYSWNKGVTWAVLTDFENVKVFCAQVIDKNLNDKLLFDISYKEFIERFDQLYLLSKEAFEKDLLDEYATKIGKKLQKVSVGAKLYEDLDECRKLLTKDLHTWNK
ncbi:MAG: hypothetical protein M0P97_04445, partial [Candidatus Moranbacteria bacterium]|nr:hypothetical protein [Candidatus Moranbacteria bacterium]